MQQITNLVKEKGQKAGSSGQSGDDKLIRLIRILLPELLLSQIGVDCRLGFEGTDFAPILIIISSYPHFKKSSYPHITTTPTTL